MLFPLVCTPENLWYMPLTKSLTFTKVIWLPFTRVTNVKYLLVTLHTLCFLKEAVTLSNHRVRMIRKIRYVIILAWWKRFSDFIAHLIHLLCCWATVNIWHVKQWRRNQSWSLSKCLSETGKNLSSSSLVPSVANSYQRVNNSSSFRSLVICFATSPVSICVVFVQPHRYLCTILESGNIRGGRI